MGYHVSLVNTNGESRNILKDVRFVEKVFGSFNLKKEYKDGYWYYSDPKNPDFTIFYQDGIYYINTTSDDYIEKLINIANAIGNDTRVVGDNGETYLSVGKPYIHYDDYKLFIENLSLHNKTPFWDKNKWFILCIVMYLIAIAIKFLY